MSKNRNEITQIELENQKNIMQKVFERNRQQFKQPKAFVDTYGCQQNESDSEKLRGMLSEMGYLFTSSEKEADVIVINTCAVREHAEKRVLGNVGALTHTKRENPNQIIAVCGCMVQQPEMADKIKRSYRHVDMVFGPHVLWRFPEFLSSVLSEHGRVFSIEDSPGAIAEGIPALRDGKIKAWLSIMYGCNNFCSYCVVPYVRGRERSRSPEVIIGEAKQLIADGYKDITLLGQNVNSYGKDLGDSCDFSEILRRINELNGDFLIRFMTSHPKDASERLFKTMAECEKVAKHIHLPFQAGNDRVLREMNRKYTQAEYLALIDSARSYMPDIVLTSDIIVGFPGETDDEFEDTLHVIEKVGFDALFTFIYSKRGGTPAANMSDNYTRQDKQRRFDKLLQLQNAISEKKHEAYIGTVQRVLIDGESGDVRFPLTARTNGGRLVRHSGEKELIGSFADVKITDCSTWSLYGEICG